MKAAISRAYSRKNTRKFDKLRDLVWRTATTDFSIESATTHNVLHSLLPPPSATSQNYNLRPCRAARIEILGAYHQTVINYACFLGAAELASRAASAGYSQLW